MFFGVRKQLLRLLLHEFDDGIYTNMTVRGQVLIQPETGKEFINVQRLHFLN